MLFRYRARNFPETLSTEERITWDKDRRIRLIETRDPKYFTLDAFRASVNELREEKKDDLPSLEILDKLDAWVISSEISSL
jgi:exodeoxyribonuclease-1